MNEVSKDLQDLVNLELPPKAEPFGRNVVKITILCFAVLLLTCVAGLVYALWSTNDALDESAGREDRLTESLDCVRRSAYQYEQAVGDAVKLIVDMDVPITRALVAVGRRDDAALQAALNEVDIIINGDGTPEHPGSEAINEAIDRAITARRTALNEC